MRFIIVTGMSGAGKSSVLRMLEDVGYFCVDNLPIPLIPKFVKLCLESKEDFEKIALGVDIRSGSSLMEMDRILENLQRQGRSYEILFLDAGTDCLVKRFKETRRTHPLASMGRIESGIEAERSEMIFLKERANHTIDTTDMLIRDLQREIDDILLEGGSQGRFQVTMLSFGYKYGLPLDADLVFDVRFLPNPYYIEGLREKTGNDGEVYEYVMGSPAANQFLTRCADLLKFLIPNYVTEGKNQLVVGVGCTGGKHRSVAIVNAMAKALEGEEYTVKRVHREIL